MRATVAARRSDSSRLEISEPTASVWPSIRKVSAGFVGQQGQHGVRHLAQRADLVARDRRRAGVEGQAADFETAHAVTDTGRTLDLVDRVEAAHLLDRRLAEEVSTSSSSASSASSMYSLRPGCSGAAAAGPGPDRARRCRSSSYAVIEIGEDVFAAVRRDARAAQDVAVAVAHGDDLGAVRPRDGFT